MTKRIPLTQGLYALCDDSDYADLMRFKWQAHKTRGKFYATHAKHYLGKCHHINMEWYLLGFPLGCEVDHINGDSLDNRRANLRRCTHAENIRNMKLCKRNTSGYKGVQRVGKKWAASICHNRKRIHLGTFEDPKDAARAYNRAAKEHFGEFARLNTVD